MTVQNRDAVLPLFKGGAAYYNYAILYILSIEPLTEYDIIKRVNTFEFKDKRITAIRKWPIVPIKRKKRALDGASAVRKRMKELKKGQYVEWAGVRKTQSGIGGDLWQTSWRGLAALKTEVTDFGKLFDHNDDVSVLDLLVACTDISENRV
ncbi:MAG TPA: hypothetical protein VLH35_06400 [Candidatus Acidoferrales bacterium]|nr:hypothetical protein [Candidatus Acidoferrales bacterium]